MSLAFLADLQFWPARERAVLILSDVLDWQASEVAELSQTSVSAVESALHRARTKLAKNHHNAAEIHIDDAMLNNLLNRYVTAWEANDIN